MLAAGSPWKKKSVPYNCRSCLAIISLALILQYQSNWSDCCWQSVNTASYQPSSRTLHNADLSECKQTGCKQNTKSFKYFWISYSDIQWGLKPFISFYQILWSSQDKAGLLNCWFFYDLSFLMYDLIKCYFIFNTCIFYLLIFLYVSWTIYSQTARLSVDLL